MPLTLRLRDVPPHCEAPLRETIETAVDGDWTVTVSQSHLDGLWHLQFDGGARRFRVVLAALGELGAGRLRQLLHDSVSATRPGAHDALS
jgi:hypothetical protein